MLKLRPYQERVVRDAISYMKKSINPIVIDSAPASGKSFMIAAIANEIHRVSGKKILCLAPSAELVNQNREKYLMTGEPCSIFSASAGEKKLKHHVVFGTPLTVLNSIDKFNDYALITVDECHSLPPTIIKIIDNLKQKNPNLRILGLSGTPYQLGNGYIFAEHADGTMNGLDVACEPYFYKCIAKVSAKEMLDNGFITPMQIGIHKELEYDTSGLVIERGQFTQESLHQTFEGKGRLTSEIIADIVSYAKNIYGGCMIFASTINHACEIMESLPSKNSEMIIGDTKKKNRNDITERYRNQDFKYLVSVGTLTTGFDVAHTSVIATLRRTMSAPLLQQILGRAWRLDDNKLVSYWLDYAGNCEEHFPDNDIYNPKIEAKIKKESGDNLIPAICPECNYENKFKFNPERDGFNVDENGYCVDLDGFRIETEFGDMPAHFGRRCFGIIKNTNERCSYRWTYKECPECGAENDITARRCSKCNNELVDPNEKLKREFIKKKKNAYEISTDKVLDWSVETSLSQAGNAMYVVTYKTEYNTITAYYVFEKSKTKEWLKLTDNTWKMPETITYVKNEKTKFWDIIDYNRKEDEISELA